MNKTNFPLLIVCRYTVVWPAVNKCALPLFNFCLPTHQISNFSSNIFTSENTPLFPASFHPVAQYSVFHTTHQPYSLPGEYVYSSPFLPFLRGGDPTPRVCRLLHFTAQALHSGWTVCRTRHTMPLLFSPCPQAAFKWPLAEEARLIYRLEGRKQVGLGLDLFQGYDYNGNLEEGRGLIGIMSFQASVHQVDVWASSVGSEKHNADLCCVPSERFLLYGALALNWGTHLSNLIKHMHNCITNSSI